MTTTYTQLTADIKAYSGRTDQKTIAAIPSFIAAAQTKLDALIRIPHQLETTTTPAGGVTIPLLAMELESVVVGGFGGVLHSYADVLAARKRPTDKSGVMYAIHGTNIEIVAPAEVIASAYTKPPRISEDAQENAYTVAADNALLWYSLSYLGTFTRDPDSTQAWGALGLAEVENINAGYEKYKGGAPIQNTTAAIRF